MCVYIFIIFIFNKFLQVIPRANKFQQRRYGGSLRCTTNPHSRQGLDGERDGSLSSGTAGASHNVGRSNSFRFNRPRNTFSSSSSSGLNCLGIGSGAGVVGERVCSSAALSNSNLSGSSSSLLCKHIKYCCLHQQQQQKNLTQNLPPCNQHHQQQLFQQQPSSHQQPSIHFVQKSYHSDYCSNNSSQILNVSGCSSSTNNCCTSNVCNNATTSAGATATATSTRLGPDGEDNASSGMFNNGLANCLANGQLHHQHQQQHHHHQQQHPNLNQHQQSSSSSSSSSANSQPNKQQPQKRHSIILERAFDFGK